MLIVDIFRWYRGITLVCSEFYVISHIIHLTQYIDKPDSVKQMCAPALLKLYIQLFFGIKHITQKNDMPLGGK